MQSETLRLSSATIGYGSKKVLEGLSLSFESGEKVAILGRSGVGKSSLLAALDLQPLVQSGSLSVMGIQLNDPSKMNREFRTKIALISQREVLIDAASALENILMGALGRVRGPRIGVWSYGRKLRQEGLELLEKVELKELAATKVEKLSGGQRQRVAIARGLMQQAQILLADEVTSSLDNLTATVVMEQFTAEAEKGKLVVAVFHDIELALKWASRVIVLGPAGMRFDGAAAQLSVEDVQRMVNL